MKAWAAAVAAAVHEMGTWAPLLLDIHVNSRADGMSQRDAREALWRAEGLMQEARAVVEQLEAAAVSVTKTARGAKHV